MILLNIAKLYLRHAIATSSPKGLWGIALTLLLLGALLLAALFYVLTWLDSFYPRLFSALLIIAPSGYILGFTFWSLLGLLKLKRERYRREGEGQ